MDLVYNLLQKIKKRPELYLGEKNLHFLFHFINGYTHRLCEEDPYYTCCLDGFYQFVWLYYNDSSVGGWCEMISYNINSPEEAFDKFFELLDKHMSHEKAKLQI